jgi:hypothetical protein
MTYTKQIADSLSRELFKAAADARRVVGPLPHADLLTRAANQIAELSTQHEELKKLSRRVLDTHEKVLDMASEVGGIDGGHHKQWALDQIIRLLTGDGYDAWVERYEAGHDGPQTYLWDTGIAP